MNNERRLAAIDVRPGAAMESQSGLQIDIVGGDH